MSSRVALDCSQLLASSESARSIPRAVMVLFSVVLSITAAVPALPASDGEGQEAAETTAAESTESENTKNTTAEKTKKGPPFIAIPIFITEPAVGYGLGGAVGYFHKKKHGASADSSEFSKIQTVDTAANPGKQHKVPPTISGIAVAYTENGTWGGGLAHTASWKQDKIRYTGALGYAHIVSTFYFNDDPWDFEFDTGLLLQDLKFRIGSSRFFVGGKLVYLTPDLVFDDELEDIPEVEDRTSLTDFGLALQGDYDGRDNKMTPNRGQYLELVAWQHLDKLGGELDYWKVGLMFDSYHPMANQKLVLGLHLDIDTAGGDAPIWGYPWISMRGIPALRYQNETTAVFASELRWNLAERWAVVGFAGIGATSGDIPVFEEEDGVVAGGLGGRYLFRPQDSLWVGIDLARGPEDWVLYVVVGHDW
ncbi:MAG: BamA/TamA family outer membrane protein [Thermoanaerobaculales bacterium]|nr:BamA/TamA family outer membrane protein [Thermoanaerobaculales bacterium]